MIRALGASARSHASNSTSGYPARPTWSRLQLHPHRPRRRRGGDRASSPRPCADRGADQGRQTRCSLRRLPLSDLEANRVWLHCSTLALNLLALLNDLMFGIDPPGHLPRAARRSSCDGCCCAFPPASSTMPGGSFCASPSDSSPRLRSKPRTPPRAASRRHHWQPDRSRQLGRRAHRDCPCPHPGRATLDHRADATGMPTTATSADPRRHPGDSHHPRPCAADQIQRLLTNHGQRLRASRKLCRRLLCKCNSYSGCSERVTVSLRCQGRGHRSGS